MKYMTLLTILVCAFVMGCDSNDGNASNNINLAGTQWRLSAWSGSSQNPALYTITADFSGSDISGRAAVNLYGGSYAAGSNGSFSLGNLFSTEMAGPEDAMLAEAHYFDLLSQARNYVVSSSVLTLRNDVNQDLLIFQAR